MPDLNALRPTDGSPGAIAAALTRIGVAGRAALAEVERLKTERVVLLAHRNVEQLEANLDELTRTMAAATQIGELLDELQQASTPSQPTPQAAALQAAADLTGWWQMNGPVVVGGLTLLVSSITSIVTAAKASVPVPRADNVAPFPPRPVA